MQRGFVDKVVELPLSCLGQYDQRLCIMAHTIFNLAARINFQHNDKAIFNTTIGRAFRNFEL